MKTLIVLLLSCTDCPYSEISHEIHATLSCSETGQKIVEEISTYYYERNGNPKLQGWYTSKGELVIGFYCDI